jgi:NAD-dependent deacetylase
MMHYYHHGMVTVERGPPAYRGLRDHLTRGNGWKTRGPSGWCTLCWKYRSRGEIIEDLIKRAAEDLIHSTYAIALTGAGISTESGIPDFRGPSGVWTKNPEEERKAYERFQRFKINPKAYWEERLSSPSLLGDLGKVLPNPGHYALAELEKINILKWVITQNVDNLHQRSGSRNVLDYHGNAFKLRCFLCNSRYDLSEFDVERLRRENQLPPLCKRCQGAIKSDTVHFTEPIPSDVANQSIEESGKCDLMLICGTSATVYPFANLPRIAKYGKEFSTIIIEINAEPTPITEEGISDYIIQGKTGQILPKIVEEVHRIQLISKKSV